MVFFNLLINKLVNVRMIRTQRYIRARISNLRFSCLKNDNTKILSIKFSSTPKIYIKKLNS